MKLSIGNFSISIGSLKPEDMIKNSLNLVKGFISSPARVWRGIKHWLIPDMRKDREQMLNASDTPRRIIYGRCRVSGQMAYVETSGSKNEYLHLILLLAGHKVYGFGDIYLDDKLVSTYGTNVEYKLFDGSQTEACAEMVAASAANTTQTVLNLSGTTVSGTNRIGNIEKTAGLFVGMVVTRTVTTNYSGYVTTDSNRITGINTSGLSIGLTITPDGLGTSANIISVGGDFIDISEKFTFNGSTSFSLTTSTNLPSNTTITYVGDSYVDISNSPTLSETNVSFTFTGTPQRWTTDHKLLGCAYIYLKLKYDEKTFASGIPKIAVVVEGKEVYDTRTETTIYSNNAAMCVRDYMLMPESIGGMGCDADEIDETSIITAANICDETVVKNVSGTLTEKRYECNGTISIDGTPKQILDSLLQSMVGEAAFSNGKWKIYAGAYVAPTATLDESWLSGNIQFNVGASKSDKINTMKGSFIDPTNSWSIKDVPILTNATYITADGGEELLGNISLNFTTSITMAQRIFKIIMEQSRLGQTIKYPCNLKAFKLLPGETVYINNTILGWSNRIFRIKSWDFSIEQGIILELKQEDSSVYNWTVGEITPLVLPPSTYLPDPTFVNTPSNIQITPSIYNFNSGSDTRVDINITWDAPSNGNFKYEIQYENTIDLLWSASFETYDNKFSIISVTEDTYNFRIRACNVLGAKSEWIEVVNIYVPNSDTSVPNVAGLEIFNQGNNGTFVGKDVFLRWYKVNPRANVTAYGPAGENKPEAWFRYYELKIYDESDVLRRTEYIQSEEYVYTHEKNHADGLGTATRTLKFSLRALSTWGEYSSIPALLTCSNPAPVAPTVTAVASLKGFIANISTSSDLDISECRVYASQTNGFTPDSGSLISSGNNTQVNKAVSSGGTWYIKACYVDTFGDDSLNYSTQVSVNVLDAQILPDDLYSSLRTDFMINNSLFYFGDSGNNPTAGTETTLYWTSGSIFRNNTTFTLSSSNITSANDCYIIATLSSGTATLSKVSKGTALPTLDNNQVIIAYTSASANSVGNYICYVRQANSMQMEGANIRDLTVTNAAIDTVTASKITSGSVTSQAITLALTEGAGDVAIKAGKTDFGDDANAGFILGIDDSDSNNPKFEIGKDDTKYLKINAAAGTLDFVGGTITSGILQTDTSGDRFVVSSTTKDAKFIGDRGDGTVETLAAIGLTTFSGAYSILDIGSVNTSRRGMSIQTDGTKPCIEALTWGPNSGYYANAIEGTSKYGYGGFFREGAFNGGVWTDYGKAPIRLFPSASSSAPTHSADVGALWVTSTGVLYICTGTTNWTKVGAQ